LTKRTSWIWPSCCGAAARNHRLDDALRIDADAGGVVRHGNAGLDLIAVAGDELALRIEVEGAVAAIGGAAVRHADAEEALAADGEVVGFSVGVMLPWVMTRPVETVLTPEPMKVPAGAWVFWSEVAEPARRKCS
jgi:hypothetical protein